MRACQLPLGANRDFQVDSAGNVTVTLSKLLTAKRANRSFRCGLLAIESGKHRRPETIKMGCRGSLLSNRRQRLMAHKYRFPLVSILALGMALPAFAQVEPAQTAPQAEPQADAQAVDRDVVVVT